MPDLIKLAGMNCNPFFYHCSCFFWKITNDDFTGIYVNFCKVFSLSSMNVRWVMLFSEKVASDTDSIESRNFRHYVLLFERSITIS